LLLVAVLALVIRGQLRKRRRGTEAAAMTPEVRDAVTAYLGGKPDLSQLRHFTATSPAAVQNTIFGFQARLGGGDRERLGVLAIELGFVRNWCESAHSRDAAVRRDAFSRLAALSSCESVRRLTDDLPEHGLKDSDPKVRLEATRALLESDQKRHVEVTFEAALALAPPERLELAPAIRRHAMQLCEQAIPKALGKLPESDLVILLRLLTSWECALTLADLGALADHPSVQVRCETMRLLAMLPPTPQNRRALMTGLASKEVEVSLAAVYALGRLRLQSAVPYLTACLRRGSESLAKAAAAVLAGLGPDGCSALEGQLPNPDPIASGAAREALGAGLPLAAEA
jgi:HEAT repeat protein